jgi:hypothetical protein
VKISAPTVLNGQTIAGDLTIENTDSVHVSDCTVSGSLSIQNCHDIYLDGCTINGPFLNVGKWSLTQGLRVHINKCRFPNLGKGVTGVTGHIVEWWNTNWCTVANSTFNITIEAGLDTSAGGWWNFDNRNYRSLGNTIRFDLKRQCYAVYRWRSDHSLNVGCSGNLLTLEQVSVGGVGAPGSRILFSSSADCGYGDFLAQCVGHWNTQMRSCVIDAAGCSIEFQGGLRKWRMLDCRFVGTPALTAFDIHGSDIERCTFSGAVHWTDQYSRPLPSPGDLIWGGNIINGTETIAAKIMAVKDWRVAP